VPVHTYNIANMFHTGATSGYENSKKQCLEFPNSPATKDVDLLTANISLGDNTILEAIKQFKYLDEKCLTAQLNVFINLSLNQWKISKRAQKQLSSGLYAQPSKVNLQKFSDKPQTLILDLDETLIHSEECMTTKVYDKLITVNLTGGKSSRVGVKLRPYCREFLEAVSRKFEVVIFTASLEDYANQVIDFLDPNGNLVSHRLFRRHCVEFERHFVKDLRIINRRMED
jgi:CTD small phosphatase-like protein 2